MTDVVDRFADLFEGSLEAYGTEEGGCDRATVGLVVPQHEYHNRIEDHLKGSLPMGVYPMRPDVTLQHPSGYAQRIHWAVKWGAVDFDEGEEESWVHAKNVHLALTTFGITGWIERSRSKGFHVWVFAQGWVPASLMRRALLAASQLVEAPTKEINPKQEELNEGQLGNYVRLMYPGALNEGHDTRGLGLASGTDRGRGKLLHQQSSRPSEGVHQVLSSDDRPGRGRASEELDGAWWCCSCGSPLNGTSRRAGSRGAEGHVPLAGPERGSSSRSDVGRLPVDGRTPKGEDRGMPRRVAVRSEDACPLCLACFVEYAWAYRTDVAALGSLAAHYVPPQTNVVYRDWTNSTLVGPPIDRLAGKALVIFQQGPLEGSDRSDTLWKLARYLKEDNRHTIDEALELLRDADRRWGKFHDRPDGEQRLTELIQRAWF